MEYKLPKITVQTQDMKHTVKGLFRTAPIHIFQLHSKNSTGAAAPPIPGAPLYLLHQMHQNELGKASNTMEVAAPEFGEVRMFGRESTP